MAFTYTPEQEQLRELVRRACGDVARNRTANESGVRGDPELWGDLRDAGLLSLGLAEHRGGAGGGIVDQVVVAQELGRVASPAPFVSSTMMAGRLLADAVSHRGVVEALGTGVVIACAIDQPASMPVTGSADGATVTGVARHVVDGPLADRLLVAGTLDGRTVVGLVDVDNRGVDRMDHPSIDRGRELSTVTFEAAPIDLVTGNGDWDERIREAVRVGCVGLAAESAGLAQHCLAMSRDYALTRRQFGEVIGQFQATKHRLADMLVLVENANAAVELGAFALAGNGDDVELSVAAAKATATEAAVRVCGEAIQLHGGIAITWEHDLHLHLRRAKTNQQLLGEPTVHREAIASRLLATAGAR